MERYEGAITALITPLDNNGRVSFDEFTRIVSYQVENGIRGIVALGTTGQGPLLAEIDEDAWEGVAGRAITRAGSRVPVIVGCGSVSTRKAVKLTNMAARYSADATLHDTGYKIGTTQEGFHDYFSSVAAVNRDMQVIMYDVRGRGHPAIEPATRVWVACDNLNARIVKEASGSAEDWVETRRIAREHDFDKHTFKMLSGDDPATYRMFTDTDIEGVGVISVWSNILPNVYALQQELLHQGKLAEAKEIDDYLSGLNNLVGVTLPRNTEFNGRSYPVRGPKNAGENYRNPEAVQYAACLLGMIESPELIGPLGVLPEEGRAVIGRELAKLYEKKPEWFDPLKDAFKVDVAQRLAPYRT